MTTWWPAPCSSGLLRKGDRHVALEVKAGERLPDVGDLRGLRAIVDGTPARRILVYRGDVRLRTEDGIEVLPIADFLTEAASGELVG